MKKPSMQISHRVKNIAEAMSIYINQLVYDLKRRGDDITTLSLGEAFFDIPMFDFKQLNFNAGYHYSDTQGVPALRKKIAEYYAKHYETEIDPVSELLISAGSKPVIFMAMQAVLNPGDEVLIHEPGWLSYQEQARLVDAVPGFIPYDCEVKNFHQYFSDKTRMVIINNPNNPAGRLYTESELLDLYQQARSRGIYVLVDEAYSDFVLDEYGEKFCSIAKVVPDKDGIILINSLSKNMGMSGWRVGYVVSTPALIQEILKLNQHLITCAPTILLYYMAHYFDDVIAVTLPQVRQVVEKRARVEKMIDDLGLSCLPGKCTFYFFLSLEDFPGTDMDFCLAMLLLNHVSVVPGSAYGKTTGRFVRVSIGAESEEKIYQALLSLKDLIRAKNFDPELANRKLEALGLRKFVQRISDESISSIHQENSRELVE